MLEAKIGKAVLENSQIEAYLAEGRAADADALITISNDFAVLANHHPTYRGRIGKGITLLHWSWSSILTKCRLLTDGGEIEDRDHRWVIEHLVRFLGHPSTGATRFDRMPASWKEIAEAVAAGAGIKKGGEAATEVAGGWIQETRDLGLQLTELLHQPVPVKLSRAERDNPMALMNRVLDGLCNEQRLEIEYVIPDGVSGLKVKAQRPSYRRSRSTCRSSTPRWGSTCGRGCPVRHELQASTTSRRRRTMEGLRQRLRNPEGLARKTLERTSTSLIVVALGTTPLEASPELTEGMRQAITWLELGILGFFTAEYVLRLWIAERPWKYAFSFYGLIDLAAILPFYLAWGSETTALRAVRLLRLVRLWKHRGYTRAWLRLSRALRESREEATIFLVASGLTLYIAAVGIHQFEADAQPEHFGTLSQSLWWAIGLLVDVDYGEIWPVTFGGKAFTAVIALVGIAIIAVPAGMMASALTRIASEQSNEVQTVRNKRGDDETQ